MNELQQVNVTFSLPEITFDLSQIDEMISLLTENYSNWVVTENDLVAAKDTSSALNKLSKQISDERIRVKKMITTPIEDFEKQVKERVAKLDILSRFIKEQLDTYEERRREERRAEIMMWESYKQFIVFDEKWLNKTTKDSEIAKAIEIQTQYYETDRATINSMCELGNLESEKYQNLLLKQKPLQEIIALINNDIQLIKSMKDRVELPFTVEEPKREDELNTVVTKRYTVYATKKQCAEIEDFAKSIGATLSAI